MLKKKPLRLTIADKNKIYKLFKQQNLTKQELANEFKCSLSVVKNLIGNFDSPLLIQRQQFKKAGVEAPITFANETWKDLIYPTRMRYQISNLGRVRSYYPDPTKPVIRQGVLQLGYLFLDYFNTERNSRIKVGFHIVVADHFLKKSTPNHNRVVHLDYKKGNNRVNNLKWVTDEQLYAYNNKNPDTILAREISNANRTKGAKLTLVKVERIRKMLADPNRKITKSRIAAMFNITTMTLYRIQSGEIWGKKGNHVPYEKKEVVRIDAKTLNAIKKRLNQKGSVQAVIAKEYGVSTTIINRIKKGKTYKTD